MSEWHWYSEYITVLSIEKSAVNWEKFEKDLFLWNFANAKFHKNKLFFEMLNLAIINPKSHFETCE